MHVLSHAPFWTIWARRRQHCCESWSASVCTAMEIEKHPKRALQGLSCQFFDGCLVRWPSMLRASDGCSMCTIWFDTKNSVKELSISHKGARFSNSWAESNTAGKEASKDGVTASLHLNRGRGHAFFFRSRIRVWNTHTSGVPPVNWLCYIWIPCSVTRVHRLASFPSIIGQNGSGAKMCMFWPVLTHIL